MNKSLTGKVKAITGANWGDEGKGKITDILAKDADIVVRFQGGSNAGHTIINELGKFALHQLPSGVFYSHIINVLANGVALNPHLLIGEISALKEKGIEPNIRISNRAHIVAPYHILLDEYEEERLGENKFGSTKSGIAPLFSDKYSKTGIQVWELYAEGFMDKIKSICEKNSIHFEHLYRKPPLDAVKIYDALMEGAEFIRPYVCDTSMFLNQARAEGKNILLEGQLGALKDIDHGIYPYVTSSPTLAGYAPVGAGIPPYCISEIIAVTKAYSSAVGEGPFVSEIFGREADELRRRGGDKGEYGATTGRPRRVGWFDAVATRYGVRLQGATEVALTGIDVLSYLDKIPVCVGYDTGNGITGDFPATDILYRSTPVLEYLPGFHADIRGISDINKLPREAKEYVRFIEAQIGVKVTLLSTGPKRDEIIRL